MKTQLSLLEKSKYKNANTPTPKPLQEANPSDDSGTREINLVSILS